MSKDKISDYSSTANSNTDIAGINIDEGCAPSGINDAIRTLMAQLKTWQSGSQDVYIHPAGSASAPSITANGDTNTGIFFPAADTIAFAEGGAEIARFDSAGNFGIGTATPATPLHVYKTSGTSSIRVASGSGTGEVASLQFYGTDAGSAAQIYSQIVTGVTTNTAGSEAGYIGFETVNAGSTTEKMRLTSSGNLGIGTSSPAAVGNYTVLQLTGRSTSQGGLIRLETSDGTSGVMRIYAGSTEGVISVESNDPLIFNTNATERARIDSSGNLLVGTTTARSKLVVEGGQLSVGSTGSTSQGIYLYINNALSDNSYLSRGSAGSGTTTWYIGNQAITTSSDQRLKANIKPSERNALDLLNQWEIVDHTWNDPSDQCENNRNSRGVWTGVVAQQVQPITPWLVNKPIEDVNEDGSINPWTMDFGYAVPLLVKALQEMKAIVDAQAAEIAALKG
jgi:hypothetical protein